MAGFEKPDEGSGEMVEEGPTNPQPVIPGTARGNSHWQKLREGVVLGGNLRKVATTSRHQREQTEALQHRTTEQSKQDDILVQRRKKADRWNSLLLIVLMYNSFMVPFRVGFDVRRNWWLTGVNLLADLILYYNIYNRFVTPVEVQGHWIVNQKQIARRYLSGWFPVDLLACFPFELIGIAITSDLDPQPILRMNRSINLVKFPTYFPRFFDTYFPQANPTIVRIAKFLIITFYLLHFMSCAFNIVAKSESRLDVLDWLDREEWFDFTASGKYVAAFDFSIRSMSGYGGYWPRTVKQNVFSFVVVSIGVVLYSTIIALIIQLVAQLGARQDAYRNKVDEVTDALARMQAPSEFRHEVMDFYRHVFETQGGVGEMDIQDLFQELPVTLQERVQVEAQKNMMRRVDMFKNVEDPEVIAEIVGMLEHHMVVAGQIIVAEGELSTDMYFVQKGQVNVIRNGNVLTTLSSGSYFGEMSLVYGEPRGATVEAITIVDVLVLAQDNFNQLMRNHAKAFESILKTARTRKALRQKSVIIQEEPATPVNNPLVTSTSSSQSLIGPPIGGETSPATTPTPQPHLLKGNAGGGLASLSMRRMLRESLTKKDGEHEGPATGRPQPALSPELISPACSFKRPFLGADVQLVSDTDSISEMGDIEEGKISDNDHV